MKNGLIFLLLMTTLVFSPYQQGFANEEHKVEAEEKEDDSGLIILPILSYMPETRTAVGAFANYFFRESGSDRHTRPSNMTASLMYTQKKQISTELLGDLYWKNEQYYLKGYLSFREFPDKLYGIGNDSKEENEENYTPRIFQFYLNFQKKILPGSYIGIQYDMEHCKLIEIENNGLLQQGKIPGNRGGSLSGLGIWINNDTRNNIFFPSSGGQYQISMQFFNRHLGSDYAYSQYTLDARRYLTPIQSHVLAVQGYFNMIRGEAPFHRLALLGQAGARNLMRGYYQGRYRDKNLIVLQTEYRLPLWWRFGAAAFLGIGDVADEYAHFNWRTIKYAYGGGLRFLLNEKEQLNLRLDVGFGKDRSGIYFTVGEAF